MSGVSPSYLGRIERGERFPSARILRKIAKHLGFQEEALLISAGYLSPQSTAEGKTNIGELDPYVAGVLSQEPVEVQRNVIAIFSIFKIMAKGSVCDIGFAEYAHRKYPELTEDIITMIEDLIEHQRIEKGSENKK